MKDNSSKLFFIEICIASLFFIFIANVCFLSFSKAKIKQLQNTANEQCITETTNAAELFLSAKTKNEAMQLFKDNEQAITTNNTVSYKINDTKMIILFDETDDMITAIIYATGKYDTEYNMTIEKAKNEH